MTNKEVSEIIFSKIKEFGFKPYSIHYHGGYFVFKTGQDSVVDFKIKGLKKWLFGIWIEIDPSKLKNENENEADYPALQFFCQYEESINKFKPAESYFHAEYNLSDILSPSNYQYNEIKHIVKSIKRHPFISYVNDNYFFESDYFEKSFIVEYLKSRFNTLCEKTKKYFKTWTPYYWCKFKLFFCGNNPIIEKIKIIDGNHDGWEISPRFTLDILFKKESTDEEEFYFLKKWFKKDYYGQLILRIHRVEINGFYSYKFYQ